MEQTLRLALGGLLALSGLLGCGDGGGAAGDGLADAADALADAAGDALADALADAAPDAGTAADADAGPAPDGSTADADAVPDGGSPGLGAPPLDPTVASNLYAETAFLYTGDGAVQQGVAPGTIAAARVALLRGRVVDRAGAPLAGVQVRVHTHPELGVTASRSDGRYDFVVNGGGTLALSYGAPGLLPVQRHVDAPWQGQRTLPDVAMTPRSGASTTIQAGAAGAQVVRGAPSDDTDGQRRATLIFGPGVQAVMEVGGATEPLTAMSVHATEYTVGETGEAAMPGELPPGVGYTYAVQLGVDEADAAGATEVRFDPPPALYLENFLHFPVGGAVPLAGYDAGRATWVPSDNGRVVAVLATNGTAALDVDGSGAAATPEALEALGIGAHELAELAALYAPGDSLWRMEIPHFSPGWDANWAWGPPLDAIRPTLDDLALTLKHAQLGPRQGPCVLERSRTCVQSQSFGESLPVAGTGWALHYASDRMRGRRDAYRLEIPLTGAIPASLQRVELAVHVGGRTFSEAFAPAPGLATTFTWDGLDPYGRLLRGGQPARVTVGYVYTGEYQSPPLLSQVFGYSGGGPIAADPARGEITLFEEWDHTVGLLDARAAGLGGLTLTPHHQYDPVARVLYLGDGTQLPALGMEPIIELFAGGGGYDLGDGGAAIGAGLQNPTGIAAAADGTVLIADSSHSAIRRVDPGGTIGSLIRWEDHLLLEPIDVELAPDGSLLVSDRDLHQVLRVLEGPAVEIVVGGGAPADGVGDGGPATGAALLGPNQLALGADGSLYVADSGHNRIRRVSPSGVIETVAGTGEAGFAGDGGQARDALLREPHDMLPMPDGSLYVADTGNGRLRRVAPDGTIETVAGGGAKCPEDGEPATVAKLSAVGGLSLAPWGEVVFGGGCWGMRVYRLDGEGRLYVLAGQPWWQIYSIPKAEGNGGPAVGSVLAGASDTLWFGADLLIADWAAWEIRRVRRGLPPFTGEPARIPSPDGSELFVFDAEGRHLETRDTLTAALRARFEYEDGLLVAIEDADGDRTVVERAGDGRPLAIVAPFGQRTELTVDADGLLNRLEDPTGRAWELDWGADGLLTELRSPAGRATTAEYDSLGRLVAETDATGATLTLAREDDATGYTVTATTAGGRERTYRVETTETGALRRVNTDAGGLATVAELRTNGSTVVTYPDGTQVTAARASDPQLGAMARYDATVEVTAGGKKLSRVRLVTAELEDREDPLSLVSTTETVADNDGPPLTRTYDAAGRTTTTATPEGRATVEELDQAGRLAVARLPGAEALVLTRDAHGRVQQAAVGTRVTTYGFDPSTGRLAAGTDPLGHTTTLERDAAGRLLSTTTPLGATWTLERDADGRVTGLVEPDGTTRHGVELDDVGRLVAFHGAGGYEETVDYDADGLPIRRTFGESAVEWRRGADGRLTSFETGEGTHTFAYDPETGQLARATSRDGQVVDFVRAGRLLLGLAWSGVAAGEVAWAYDAQLRVSELRYGGATIALSYDADDLPVSVGAATFERDPQTGHVLTLRDGAFSVAYGYDGFGDLASVTAAHGGAVLAATLERDAKGRASSRTETVLGETHTWTYAYDADDRLTEVRRDGAVEESYAYDATGDRTRALSTRAGLDVPQGGAVYDADHRLLQAGAATFTYDAGRLATRSGPSGTDTLSFAADGLLRQVALAGGPTVGALYDAEGRRVARTVDGALTHTWLYGRGLLPLAEHDASGALRTTYLYAGAGVPYALVRGGQLHHVVTDPLGSPRLVLDATGAVVRRIDYDAWGVVVLDTNPAFDLPFGYAGGTADPAHDLLQLGALVYAPRTGRWTAPDPLLLAGDPSLYRYARNDPVNRKDPLGLQATEGCHSGEALRELFETGAYKQIEVVEVDSVHVWHDHTSHKWTPKKNELVADATGVKYAVEAGYHPAGLLGFLQVLKMVEDIEELKGTPKKESSLLDYEHPPTPLRIDKLRPLVDKVEDTSKLKVGKHYKKLYKYLGD